MENEAETQADFWRKVSEVYDRNLAAELRAKREDKVNIGLVGGAPQS